MSRQDWGVLNDFSVSWFLGRLPVRKRSQRPSHMHLFVLRPARGASLSQAIRRQTRTWRCYLRNTKDILKSQSQSQWQRNPWLTGKVESIRNPVRYHRAIFSHNCVSSDFARHGVHIEIALAMHSSSKHLRISSLNGLRTYSCEHRAPKDVTGLPPVLWSYAQVQ